MSAQIGQDGGWMDDLVNGDKSLDASKSDQTRVQSGGKHDDAGVFLEQCRNNDLARVQQEQKKRSQLISQARYQMSRALNASRFGEAIKLGNSILNDGGALPNDLMKLLIHGVAERPGGRLFAEAVALVSRGGIKFDEHGFASLIGRLMAREAPQAQVRCALNFGLRPDAEVISLEPTDGRDEEKRDCYKGMEKDDGMDPELSDEEISGKPGENIPRILEFRACVLAPRLNGCYSRRLPELELLGHSLPVYERRSGNARWYVYYHDETLSAHKSDEWKSGWYIGSEVGGGGQTVAHCPCQPGVHPIPPREMIWKIKVKDGWKTDSPGFTKAEKTTRPVASDEEVEAALASVDLTKLRGSVEGRDHETCTYFAHFFVLLSLEHLTELRGFRSRWGFRNATELVGFGLCFTNIYVEEIRNKRDDAVNMPLPGWPNNGTEVVSFKLPWHAKEDRVRMKNSESVLISRGDPLKSRVAEGSIRSIDFVGRWLQITLNGHMPEDHFNKLSYRIDIYANRTTYERQVVALLEFVAMERTRICDMLVAAKVGQVDLAVLGGDGFMANKDKLGGDKSKQDQAEEAARAVDEAQTDAHWKARMALAAWNDDGWFSKEIEQSKVKSASDEVIDEERKAKVLMLANQDVEGIDMSKLAQAKEEVFNMPSVSVAQKDAIESAMSKRLTIVQGPPGTGKTHTSVRIITKWVQTMGYKPLLATSECNVAVDNIAIGLVKNGVRVVRMGNETKVNEELKGHCINELIKKKREEMKKDDDEESEDIEEVGEEPWGDDWSKYKDEWEAWDRRRLAHRRKRDWEEKQAKWLKQQIIEEAEVIAATTINSGSHALSGIKFHGILIDEVAQATETSSIVPIVCRGASQLVLCGDHCQLPPSVQSREAELRGYSLSLYSRLVEAGVPFRFLDTQYRAHPMLMEFSAHCIYQGKLKNGIDGSGRPQVKGVPWPSSRCPAAFFPSDVEEHLEGESKANEAEAKKVLRLVRGVLDAGELDVEGIGVVTPYKGQVRVLRRILEKGLNLPAERFKKLQMASVDNFQGSEKELIIFSAVRCNDYGGVGFLKDWRRLNVMITRARRGLVIVGNADTLCHDPHWRLWLEFTEKQGGSAPGTVEMAMQKVNAGKGAGKGRQSGKRPVPGGAGGQSHPKKAKVVKA